MGKELYNLLKTQYGSIERLAEVCNCSRQLIREVLCNGRPSKLTDVIYQNAREMVATLLNQQIRDNTARVSRIQKEIEIAQNKLQQLAA